ncbi:hypothetical protein A2331_04615 [Candidatus Falkowbacteria bacterium RIFOXYB2_FULL_34_18]|uniref:Major facilitator superfamily (MFS) profile domain-containing protein n=1 Tax=Candidatus Falkowbacteria bacterium RIFOXYD2_FULL_34_120 TaxID=1798007 RepID=A0A1F5TPW2_9BACT|nr:MAG: hypothetical protein A2331_04615 [Candidatus Falkowbacteria bacterium RIFOXYB2_FULL_34_18]OGF29349.1 MAG: hypothetical protein A2500_06200 [Candidatus Falkowbacteria bacterium RIFOXYC12_FULL_34_55]OGF36540.1 MAG: hypothetical protein A2466_07240 [Candidatus Falkowbacteria bacterium RIFOXYC2_FULL_34_220]OGF38772.1 MAG: hypothetical protein A2515_03350 [Candidatus Falkowbacteria bacterium RIFOXYD12_FULL_34_57]OGF41013.1 MAG: hypothetical protein A2531_03595 [Candidatus Falkowbacteria bact
MKPNNTWFNYLTLKSVNKIIRILTVSDLIILSGYGLISPIFAIYIADSIKGGTVEVIGIASAIYLLSKSLGQIPIATTIDKIKGEKDDFWFLFSGSILFSLIPLLYLIINAPWQLYIIQALYGFADGIVLPSWYAIFTRHIDKDHEGLEWGIYRTLTDLGGAGAASIGGFLAFRFGFSNLFIVISILSFIGTMFLLGIRKNFK